METQQNNLQQQSLPNATTVLVLGICSLVFCGFIGLVLSIISLVMANKDKMLYDANPMAYSTSSLSNLNAGRTCAIIGVILSSLSFLALIIYVIFVGSILTTIFSQI